MKFWTSKNVSELKTTTTTSFRVKETTELSVALHPWNVCAPAIVWRSGRRSWVRRKGLRGFASLTPVFLTKNKKQKRLPNEKHLSGRSFLTVLRSEKAGTHVCEFIHSCPFKSNIAHIYPRSTANGVLKYHFEIQQ